MTQQNTTLTSLWVDEGGTASPMKVIQTTPAKASNSGSELKEDIFKIYKDSGLERMAKEAGILNENGDLTSPQLQPKTASIPLITLPVHYSSAATVPGSPMVIGTPQRLTQQIITGATASPSTAQLLATPLSMESPQSWSRKRSIDMIEADYSDGKRGKKGEKGGKGLRHFSMKVCEKVQKKGTTSYNEVADELVAEFTDLRSMTSSDSAYDQKNIRRRVYDALNVLMAMNIISKEKKEIKWIGLPTNSAQECQNLLLEKQRREERIRVKTQQLQELILQQIAFKNLVQRNRQREIDQGPPQANSAIHLPFIIVNTSKQTVIDCSISNDKYEYLFNFNNTFEIHDDIEVLKRMGMAFGLEKGRCGEAELKKCVDMVPKSLQPYVIELARQHGSQGSSSSATLAAIASVKPAQSPLALPLAAAGYDPMDAEVAMATSQDYSRQSSVGSFSDLHGTPSEPFSESESERASPIDMS